MNDVRYFLKNYDYKNCFRFDKKTRDLVSDEAENLQKSLEKDATKANTSLFSEDSDEDLFSSVGKSSVSTKEHSKTNLDSPKTNKNRSKTSSRKMKHDLNINVTALLPGSGLIKNKITSPENKAGERNEEMNTPTPSDDFLDSPIENVDILTSAAKVSFQIIRLQIYSRYGCEILKYVFVFRTKLSIFFLW